MSVHILHTADIHWHPDRQTEALASLQTLYDHAAATKPNLIVMAGDLFDKGVQASTGGGYPALIGAIQALMNLCPVVTVQGTITHDVPGCYGALEQLTAGHSFTVLDPASTYYLADGDVYTVWKGVIPDGVSLLIYGCGEPCKGRFLADKIGIGRAEATEAINDGMRQILAGIGARRAELPEVPALMVYHGTVRGSTMCNGQTVPGTDIAIGRDDLALTGCDYTALGHIHQAQEVGECACYAGSAYPVDWGETDQKSFWDVTITPDLCAEYHRINYPHPPRVKIVTDWATADDEILHEDVNGFQVWQVYRVTKEELPEVNEGELLNAMADWGVLPGSRVTTELIPTETVRAGEIQEAESLRAKVTVWHEASKNDQFVEWVEETVLEKADGLEQALTESGDSPTGMRYRVKSLRLRGAIGILKGTGKEEIELNLDDYDPGLIALAGVNGAGKSTLIENLHPYPCMLTRGGSLQSHFALKDSYRDLTFVDDATGDEYRAYILIDPTLATPKAEYHLYRNGTPITNGRKEDYEREVNRICGSLSLYVRSAFTAQKASKAAPDLSDATKGEKKELFRELGGLDYLQAYAEAAKERKQTAEESVRVDEGKAELLAGLVAELPAVESARRGGELAADRHAGVTADIQKVGTDLRIEVDALAERVKAQDAKRQQLEDLDVRMAQLEGQQNTARNDIEHAQDAAENGPKAAEIVQKHADLTKAQGGLVDERTEHLKGQAALDEKYRVQMERYQPESNALQEDLLVLERRKGSLGSDKAGLVARVDALSAKTEMPIDETCPTCRQTLPEVERTRLQAERATELSDLAGLQDLVLACDNSVNAISEQQAAAQAKIADLVEPQRQEIEAWAGKVPLGRIEAELATIDLFSASKMVTQAEQAAVRIEEGGRRLHDLSNQLQEIEGKMELLKADLDDELDQRHQDRFVELEDLRVRYTEAEKRGVELQTEIRGLDEQIEKLKETEETLYQLREAIAKLTCESREWAYLQRACGPDGIQALELDAMGPSITEVANRLLGAAYGTRFRIEIRTTRMAGKGSNTRQVEDFEIVVHDGDGEQALDTLSGGEAVWIKRALFDAFSVIRDRNTGTRFLTVCQDEADGALDPEARGRYLDMLQAAHVESGRHQTLLISHSPEVQQAVAQRIEMAELMAPVREA